jgi:hypothetical protein
MTYAIHPNVNLPWPSNDPSIFDLNSVSVLIFNQYNDDAVCIEIRWA